MVVSALPNMDEDEIDAIPEYNMKLRNTANTKATIWLEEMEEENIPIEVKTPANSVMPIYDPIITGVSILPAGLLILYNAK